MLSQSITRLIEIALLAGFALIFATFVWQLLSGRILISGMLAHRSGRLRFHRLQMIGISLIFAGAYAVEAFKGGVAAGSLPDISTSMLALLVGSHATYLGGKIIG